MIRRNLTLTLALCAAAPTFAAETLDWATIGRIRDEGFRRSQVMETAAQLTDVHGPRLSGSPQYKQAAEWARQQLETWGLSDAHLEPFAFGRGWTFERCSAHVVAPDDVPARGAPEGLDRRNERRRARQGGAREGRVRGGRREVEGQARGRSWSGPGEPRELKVAGGARRLPALQREAARRAREVPAAGPAQRRAAPRAGRRSTARRSCGGAGCSQALEKLYAAEKPLAVGRALGARRQRAAARQRRLAQEGRPAGGDAARGVGGAVGARGAAPRPQARGRGRDRREGARSTRTTRTATTSWPRCPAATARASS